MISADCKFWAAKISLVEAYCPSQKPFLMASVTEKVMTELESEIPGTTNFSSTIASAICGLRPVASAVLRIMERM